MADDDGGVLGNLPRSRPGQRSGKRPGEDAAAKPKAATKPKAAAKPKAGARKAAPRKPKTAPKVKTVAKLKPVVTPRPAAKPKVTAVGPRQGIPVSESAPPRSAPQPEPDRVTDALRSAGKIAGTSVRVAAGLAQEVVRRLPRR